MVTLLSMSTADYTEHDSARLVAETAKHDAMVEKATVQTRTPFARDRARVLHSAALRRLAGKTQVVGPDEADVPRTRLTHSLEVAQISREIGISLGCDPDVVDAAGLAHDIGHPPFGHNGEQALNEIAKPCGGFEGNAQNLRILTRLEPKILIDHHSHGLNLTRAVLDATIKYPWPRRADNAKFGVYADDQAVFAWIRDQAPGQRRCLEAQIMDWADDVAYSVHDVEDGVLSGRISFTALANADERVELAAMATANFTDQPMWAVLAAADELLSLPAVAVFTARQYDGSLGAQAALKALTSTLVGRFVSAAITETKREYGDEPLRRYQADLRVPQPIAAEVALLKTMAWHYVMRDPRRIAVQSAQRELIVELVNALTHGAPDLLDPVFHPAWQAASDDCARARVLVDQVASLTDAQAIAWHARLVRR